jgi:hypothetical protein
VFATCRNRVRELSPQEPELTPQLFERPHDVYAANGDQYGYQADWKSNAENAVCASFPGEAEGLEPLTPHCEPGNGTFSPVPGRTKSRK